MGTLFNVNIDSPFSLMVIALNAMGAGFACGWNVVAAARAPHRFRPIHSSIATLAAVYVVGYAWLLASDVAVTTWSALFRGVSLIAWPLVWIGPAAEHSRRDVTDRVMTDLVEAVAEQMEADGLVA